MTIFSANPFEKSWTLAATSAFVEGYAAAPKSEEREAYKKWQEEVFRPQMKSLETAVSSHLLHLGQEGRLGPLLHVEGTSVGWFRHWEGLRTGTIDQEDLSYARGLGFCRALYMRMAGHSRQPLEIESLHEKLTSMMSAGCFDDYELDELHDCALTGERFFVRLDNWNPTVGRMADVPGAQFGIGFVPLSPGQFKEPGVEHVVIPLPSGELLIDDWFRIPEFKAAVSEAEGEGGFSVNAVKGRTDQTRCYAEKLGFVSVSVGNSMPSIVLNDGVISVGRLRIDDYTEDSVAPEGREIGSVCTDLWWATMIDREVLTQILASKCSRDQAEAKVVDLLLDRGDTTKIVHLPPGEYHLYFSGDRQIFKENFASEEVSTRDFEVPMLVLSPTKLTLVDPASRPSRRPSP